MSLISKALGAILFFFSFSALAAPSYCYFGPGDPAPTVTDDGGGNLSDVTLGGVSANNCYGVVVGNDNAAAVSTIWGPGWTLAAKDNVGGSDDESHVVSGLKWTVSAASDDDFYSGTWSLGAIDTNGGASANLGDLFDFVAVLKAGRAYVMYEFDDLPVTSLMSGDWGINFLNPVSGEFASLSHLSVYTRYAGEGPPNDVPEPGSLALAGLAFAGLALTRRRQPKTAVRA